MAGKSLDEGRPSMVKWLVMVAALAVAGCASPRSYQELTRSLAGDVIRKGFAEIPPVIGITTGDVELLAPSQEADAFLAELQSLGFRWSGVEPHRFRKGEFTVRGLKLPDQWGQLIVKRDGRSVFVRLGKDPRVTVTGIQRSQNEAKVEFDFEWRVESGPAKLAAIMERFYSSHRVFVPFLETGADPFGARISGCLRLKGKGRATLKLYDDGWRMTDGICRGE
jgi:hypothetical protein